MDEATARIPLRNRKGEVVAHALVDATDEPAVTAAGPWHLDGRGYAVHTLVDGRQRKMLRMHRLVLGLELGDPLEGDHRNHDPLDNRRANLRVVTHRLNGQNKSPHRGATSRHRGVYLDRKSGKWRAMVGIGGVKHNLGRFATEDDAATAARAFRLAHMPGAVD